MIVDLLTQSTVALLFLELVKFVYRFVAKKPDFTFPKWFYLVSLPTLQLVSQPFLVWLEVLPVAELVFSWKLVIQTLLGSLASVVLYDDAYKPLVNPEP